MTTLAELQKNDCAIIQGINESLLQNRIDLKYGELERRLIEMGIIENMHIKVLHFGLVNKDPIAIRIQDNGVIVALRRNEANTILVTKL